MGRGGEELLSHSASRIADRTVMGARRGAESGGILRTAGRAALGARRGSELCGTSHGRRVTFSVPVGAVDPAAAGSSDGLTLAGRPVVTASSGGQVPSHGCSPTRSPSLRTSPASRLGSPQSARLAHGSFGEPIVIVGVELYPLPALVIVIFPTV